MIYPHLNRIVVIFIKKYIFLLTFKLKKSIINNVEIRRNTQVWLKGSVLKTERGVKACGGSNPSSSSIYIINNKQYLMNRYCFFNVYYIIFLEISTLLLPRDEMRLE